MVAPAAAWTWVAAIATSGLLLQQIVKVRLPAYDMRVTRFPQVKRLNGEFLTRLQTDVALHNDNYMKIDVHGLAFDLFYASWDGALEHIGHIQDEVSATVGKTLSWRRPPRPLWKISPRADFRDQANLYVSVSFSNLFRTIGRLLYQLVQGRGALLMPCTGVAYIKASVQTPLPSAATPFTVSIVCDNLVNAFSLRIQGIECALQQLKPGWPDMDYSVIRWRNYTLTHYMLNETGGVLNHPQPETKWEALMRRLALEEVMQLPS